jgi:thiamine biosynthesis protein ThiS
MNTIILNGDPRKTAAVSVVELLQELELPLSIVLVEQNGLALHRHELEKAPLAEGDKIEILKVAAGG